MSKNALELVTDLDGVIVGSVASIPYDKVMDILEEAIIALINAEAEEEMEEIEKHSIRVLSLVDASSQVLTNNILQQEDVMILVSAFDRLLRVVNSPINQWIVSEERIEKLKTELFDFLTKSHGLHNNPEILKICITTASTNLVEGIKEYSTIKEILESIKM